MPIETRGMCPLLFVYDMPTAIHFYRDVLGFEVGGTSKPGQPGDDFGWCLLKFGGGELMLNTAYDDGERPPAPDPERVASHGDTTLYFACEDLDGAYQYLRAQGVDAKEPKVAYYGMKQLYLRDPDGFGVCLQWPAGPKTHDQ
jgi:glyoxylase I family protein